MSILLTETYIPKILNIYEYPCNYYRHRYHDFCYQFFCHRRYHLTHYLIIKIITDLVISIVIDMINHHFSLEKEVSHTPLMYTVG